MIALPSQIICSRIIPHRAYCDEKSTESSTGKIKRKYKVAAHHITKTIVFFVLNSNYQACKYKTTFAVTEGEWVNRNPAYLKNTSYLDVTKLDVLAYEDVAGKISDNKNRFHEVAELPKPKLKDLKRCLAAVQQGSLAYSIPTVIKDAIRHQENELDIVLKSLNLL